MFNGIIWHVLRPIARINLPSPSFITTPKHTNTNRWLFYILTHIIHPTCCKWCGPLGCSSSGHIIFFSNIRALLFTRRLLLVSLSSKKKGSKWFIYTPPFFHSLSMGWVRTYSLHIRRVKVYVLLWHRY